ncbi:hypothetical protein PLANPX_4526 [Lacipirellula parvula]|uniref:Uncharacterized protein n=1 Tax=Lacipirellula parvula TaxID=2650471 RepID=A0A5K7XDM2_9BACT|nr:hypothetical protein PLANPX_4526 [Lacipirellula parvula]
MRGFFVCYTHTEPAAFFSPGLRPGVAHQSTSQLVAANNPRAKPGARNTAWNALNGASHLWHS